MGLIMGRKAKVQVIIWTFLILIMMILINSIPVSASPLTVVTLSLQGEPPQVDVSPGSSGIVAIEGNATCLKYGPDEVKVALVGSSDIGGASVEPPNMVFSGMSGSEEIKPFKMSTRVPQGTTSAATPQVLVSGSFVQGGLQYNINPVTTIIEVLPYFKIEGKIQDTTLSVDAGESVTVVLRVTNVGNCEDRFHIDMVDRERYQNNGFLFPSEMEVPFAEKENMTIYWEIDTKSDMSGGYPMEISILSRNSESDQFPITAVLSFQVKVTSQSISHQVISFVFSPLVIMGIILVVIIAVVYKKRKSS
jgi:hypothetical protein